MIGCGVASPTYLHIYIGFMYANVVKLGFMLIEVSHNDLKKMLLFESTIVTPRVLLATCLDI